MAITITSAMLNKLRQHIADICAYGRYKVGNTWYRADISSASVQSNGAVHVMFYISQPSGTTGSATGFQLCDANGNLLAERAETVPFSQYTQEINIRFKFGVSVGSSE